MRALRAIFSLILVICTLTCGEARGQSAKERKARLERDIKTLESQLKANEKKTGTAESDIYLLQGKISARRELLTQAEKELKVLGDSLKVNTARLKTLQQRLDTLNFYYSKLIKNAYKNRDSRLWYMYILSSSGLGQGARRYTYLRDLSSRMNVQAAKIKQTSAQLEAQKKALEALSAEARKARDNRKAELASLQKDQDRSKALVKKLQKDKALYQKQLATKKKQVDELDKALRRVVTSSVGATTKKKKNIDTKLSGEFSANMGKLPWPADGRVVGKFGKHRHPVYTKVELPFNNGINIATAENADVRAVFDGVVKQIIVMPGYNQCVLVQHGEFFTFYCKLGTVSVKAGQKVTTSQILGKVTKIGHDTQLHFQLWQGSTPQDPELWLR